MVNRIDHIGMSVSNLERSIEFYRSGLGLEVSYLGTFEPNKDGGKYETIMALQGATGRVALVKSADLRLELFEFSHPRPKPSDPNRPVCDHGITHFCIEVSGIEEVYERLKAVGASFHCPPLVFGKAMATYCRDPDGNVFELLQRPSPAPSP